MPGMFRGVKSADDFANVLHVPKKSIPLVVPDDAPCRSDGCRFLAIKNNGGHCPAHQRSWYPLLNTRGGDLLGPEFLRSNCPSASCDCVVAACKSAGYFPLQGPLHIPAAGHETAMKSPGLLSREKKEALQSKGGKRKDLRLYPWHFFPEHREQDDTGKWTLKLGKAGEEYRDLENKKYDFPPPRNIPKSFLDSEYFTASYIPPRERWAQENAETKMPSWMLNMLVLDGSSSATPRNNVSRAELLRQVEMWKARAVYEQKEKKWLVAKYDEKLADAAREFKEKMSAAAEKHGREKASLEEAKTALEKELAVVQTMLEECKERKAAPLRYTDLYGDGVLAKAVDAYTLFDTVEQNDAFLELLDYSDGSEGALPEGDGLCQNLRNYSKVAFDERSGKVPAPSMDPNSAEYKERLRRSKAAKQTFGRSWKDDYLTFCLYVRTGLTQDAVAGLCGISATRVSDIFHAWAQVLDAGLQEMFPRPTRKQMLSAFPSRFIEADGDARTFLCLDAFECFAEASSNYNVASTMHSSYKGHTTVKFLGGVDPIGCSWAETVPDGSPGGASDVVMTKDTKVLRQVPFGHVAKVDKGFIVDNEAAREGVIIDRPQKRLRYQVQQSSVDTSQTQKLGNTRIVVENVNGELKLQIRYLNVLIPCLQLGIVSKIVRVGYLLQNFKKAIIQHRPDEDQDESGDGAGRPCRAEVRWYGASDAGLRDVRDNIRLWGLESEIKRHAELTEQHRTKSPTEISDMVLDEGISLKKRKQLYTEVHKVEYDGV